MSSSSSSYHPGEHHSLRIWFSTHAIPMPYLVEIVGIIKGLVAHPFLCILDLLGGNHVFLGPNICRRLFAFLHWEALFVLHICLSLASRRLCVGMLYPICHLPFTCTRHVIDVCFFDYWTSHTLLHSVLIQSEWQKYHKQLFFIINIHILIRLQAVIAQLRESHVFLRSEEHVSRVPKNQQLTKLRHTQPWSYHNVNNLKAHSFTCHEPCGEPAASLFANKMYLNIDMKVGETKSSPKPSARHMINDSRQPHPEAHDPPSNHPPTTGGDKRPPSRREYICAPRRSIHPLPPT